MSEISDRCATCEVRDSALCASLSDNELSILNDIGRRKTIECGQVIAWAGDPSTICANLVSGVLKVTTSTSDGREQTVGLLFPGDFVGQPFAKDLNVTITAVSDVDLCVYQRPDFERALDSHARLERMLLQRTMATLDEARARMLTLARKSAREKVAGFLSDMAERTPNIGDEPGVHRFELPLGRGQIADLLGMAFETVSRQITRLKAEKIINLPGGRFVEIRDTQRLLSLS